MMLLGDEGVDKLIVEGLRTAGFEVLYILESYQGSDDTSILGSSNQQQRILLTQDKDFVELVFRLKNVHFGVVSIRLTGQTAIEKANIVVRIIIEHQIELVKAFTVIQPKAVGIRK